MAAAGGAAGAGAPTADADAGVGATIQGVRVRREPAPVLLRRDARCELFAHCDNFFGVPKLQVNAQLRLPAAQGSPRAACLLDLYVRLLTEALNELTYAATTAGLHFSVAATSQGPFLQFGGFAHKMPVLVAAVAARAARLHFSDVQFTVQRDRVARKYANWAKDQPVSHAIDRAQLATSASLWSVDDKARALAEGGGIDAAALRAFVPELLRHAHARVLVSGNATAAEARAVADALLQPFEAVSAPPPAAMLSAVRSLRLPAPLSLGAGGAPSHANFEFVYALPARNAADNNAAMCYALQVGATARGAACAQSALVELAAHLLGEPYFDELRTKQQLGYVVQAGPATRFGVEYIRFLVQSSKVPAAELVRRTDAFLAAFVAGLAAMPADKFASNVKAVAVRRSESDKNVFAEGERLWGEVHSCALDFARATHEVRALFALTQEQVVGFFRDFVLPGGTRRRALIALIEGGTAVEAGPAVATAKDDGEEADDEGGDDGEEEEDEEEEGEGEAANAGAPAAVAAAAPSAPAAPAPLPAADPTPVLDISFAQAGALLQHLEGGGGAAPGAVALAREALAAAGLLGRVEAALGAGGAAVRLRVAVPSTEDAPALVRSLLPTVPDMAGACAALNEAAAAARVEDGAAAGAAVVVASA